MKKTFCKVVLFILIGITTTTAFASANTKDVQAVWMATVYNIDYPSTKNNITAQKDEYIQKIDKLKEIGINTIVVQVRPKADALYRSNINPWSDVLTGTQGKNPGYDPMAFMIEEAHKRGMDFHAWLNPYRVTTSGTDVSILHEKHPARLNPDWLISHNNALYYNPKLEAVRQHIVDTVEEIIKKYNVDAIHFDDYFYPSKYPLPEGEGKDGVVANSRRQDVNNMIKNVGQAIKKTKPNVLFGVSPIGIWKNKKNDLSGSSTTGNESYYAVYGDTRTWIKNEWIDYVVPQIYWETGHKAADYETLVKWWENEVKGTKVKLYIGQGIYREAVASQIDIQLNINKKYSKVEGSFYYSLRSLLADISGSKEKIVAFNKQNNIIDHLIPLGSPDTSQLYGKIGTITANKLNIRSGNGIQYGIVTQLGAGSEVTILSKNDEWYHIKMDNNQTGWANVGYVNINNSDAVEVSGSTIKIKYNGKEVQFPDAKPYIDNNDRTQIPIRFVAGLMNYEVKWEEDGKKNTVTLMKGNTKIDLKIGDKFALVNGVQQNLDTTAKIVQDRTYVPLRFLSEIIGNEVKWDAENKIAWVTDKVSIG